MKSIHFFLFITLIAFRTYPQSSNYDLPPEFKNVAIQAFQKVSPTTKQWFINAAKQHPAGLFDTAWAKKKLAEKFTRSDMQSMGELLIVMLAYQKMASKDAREDRKIATTNKQLNLTNKNSKLELDKSKIEQQKKEAEEKADNAMTAAQTNLWIGIVSGNSAVRTNGMQKVSPIHLSPIASQNNDSSKLKQKPSNFDRQKQKAEQDEKDAEEERKASEEHKKKMRDAIQKLLDEMGRMKQPDKNP